MRPGLKAPSLGLRTAQSLITGRAPLTQSSTNVYQHIKNPPERIQNLPELPGTPRRGHISGRGITFRLSRERSPSGLSLLVDKVTEWKSRQG